MSVKLTIIGAGGHGKVVAEAAKLSGYREIAFVDQQWPVKTKNGHWPIVAKVEDHRMFKGGGDKEHFFCALGNNKVRQDMLLKIKAKSVPVLCHPSSICSSYSKLGHGTLMAAGSIVNPDSKIGVGVILNTASSVDHDCSVGDFVHISPGARLAGNVTIGARSWIGIGAVIREGIEIGTDVIVGAGAVVINNIKNGICVAGIPAREIEVGQ